MRVNPGAGLLDKARQRPSPNRDERPTGVPVDLIVIHNISLPPGEFGGPWIDDLFCNRLDPEAHPYFAGIHTLRVSSHLLIRRDGAVVQYVPFHQRAWHAGESCYQGRRRCNDYAIGIELEGTDWLPFEAAQYTMLETVVAALLHAYPTLDSERITGHSDIAPGRKTDPGPCFERARFQKGLQTRLLTGEKTV